MAKEHSNVRLGFWCLTQMGSLYFTGTLLLGVATAAGLAAALLFQPLFDKGLIGRDGSVLLSIVALQLALMLSRILLTRGALDLLARAGARLGQRLALRLYEHLQRQSVRYFLETKQADLLQLMRGDIALIDDSVGQLSGWVVIGAFEAIGMLVVIVLWQPAMALVSSDRTGYGYGHNRHGRAALQQGARLRDRGQRRHHRTYLEYIRRIGRAAPGDDGETLADGPHGRAR